MRLFLSLSILLFLGACLRNTKGSVDDFRTGTFRTVLEDNESESMAVRNDSIQIETFNNRKDTFAITWLDPFEYVLKKKNPQTLLDSTAFHVKIVRVSGDCYDFKAFYSGSRFQQKGTAYKMD